MIFRLSLLALLMFAPLAHAEQAAGTALDFAVAPAVIDLSASVQPRGVKDATDPNGEWFTLAVQNRTNLPVARVLAAAEPPGRNPSVSGVAREAGGTPLVPSPTVFSSVGRSVACPATGRPPQAHRANG